MYNFTLPGLELSIAFTKHMDAVPLYFRAKLSYYIHVLNANGYSHLYKHTRLYTHSHATPVLTDVY